MKVRRSQPEFEFECSGGALCLDFINTVSRRRNAAEASDHVATYADLVEFARQTKMISLQRASELRRQAQKRPREAARVLRLAVGCREALFRALSAVADGKRPEARDVQQISRAALAALRHRQLAPAGADGRWQWQWSESRDLEQLLWPIVESAVGLVTSGRVTALRECAASNCAWLFLDESRNHSRRWCDMKVCGNRQKARRHYLRAKP